MAKATIGSCDLLGSPPSLPKQIHQTGLVTHAGLVPCSNHFTAFYAQVNRKGKLARMRLEALDLRLRGFWNQVGMSRITPFTHEWTNGMLAEKYAILPPPQVNASRSLPPLCLSAINSKHKTLLKLWIMSDEPGWELTQTIPWNWPCTREFLYSKTEKLYAVWDQPFPVNCLSSKRLETEISPAPHLWVSRALM